MFNPAKIPNPSTIRAIEAHVSRGLLVSSPGAAQGKADSAAKEAIAASASPAAAKTESSFNLLPTGLSRLIQAIARAFSQIFTAEKATESASSAKVAALHEKLKDISLTDKFLPLERSSDPTDQPAGAVSDLAKEKIADRLKQDIARDRVVRCGDKAFTGKLAAVDIAAIDLLEDEIAVLNKEEKTPVVKKLQEEFNEKSFEIKPDLDSEKSNQELKEILNEDRFDLNAFVDLAKKVLTETEFDKHVKPLVDIKEKIADYRTRQKVIQEQPIAALKAQVEELLVQTNLPVNDDYKDYTRQLALSCCTQELDSQAIILFEKASRPLIQEAYPQIGGAPAKMLLKTVIDNSKLKAGLAADHGMKVVYLANRQEQIHVTAKYSMLVAVYHEIATEQVVKAEQLPLYRFDVDLEANISTNDCTVQARLVEQFPETIERLYPETQAKPAFPIHLLR